MRCRRAKAFKKQVCLLHFLQLLLPHQDTDADGVAEPQTEGGRIAESASLRGGEPSARQEHLL